MSLAEKYSGLVETYKADVYTRTYAETIKKNFLYKYTHHVPKLVLHDPNNDQALIETLSKLTYRYPNTYEHIIRDVSGTITRQKYIDMIPINMLNFNVYGETANEESFFMPIRFSTSKYYTYHLANTYTENNKTYYTIDYSPIYENQKLLKGTFIVESGTWRVIFFRGIGIGIFSDFSIEITMGSEWVTNYLPTDFTFYQTVSYLGNVVANRHFAHIDYKNIVLRSSQEQQKSLNISNINTIGLNSVSVKNDSAYWNNARRIPLQAREKDVLSDFEKRHSEKTTGNDSSSVTGTVQQLARSIVSNSHYTYKTTEIGYAGLLNPALLGYSSHDGITYKQRLFFHIGLPYERNLKINAYAGYLFKRKEFFTDVTTTWNYNPFRLGSATLSVGKGNATYSSLFIEQIQDSLKKHGLIFEDISPDYFRDYYLKLFNTFEPTNGLLLSMGMEYHIRKSTERKPKLRATSTDTENIENFFGTRRAFMPFVRFEWTPEQYYRYEGRQKIYVRSRYPTFKMELARSFKDIFGSTSAYNRVEVDISQSIPLGLMNSIHYHVGAGLFTNQTTEYFADFYFFSKNNFPEIWDDRLGGGFNLLNRHLYNASDSYIQAHVMFETPFLFLNNIPFISSFAKRENLYLSQLYTPQIISYTELGYGIGNRYFNAAVFGSFHNLSFRQIGARATFSF